MEIESHGGGLRRAADEDADAEAFARGIAHGRQGMPGDSDDHDDPRNAAGPGHAISPVVPGDPGDLADPRGPSTAGESGGIASAIPHIPGMPQAPGPGGDTAPRARVLNNRVFQLYPIPGAPVGWMPAVVRVQNRGGLGVCRWRGLNCRRRVLWGAGGYGSGVVWLPGDGGEEKQPEGNQRVGW